MAHFAKVELGLVTQVIAVSNDDCGGGEFPASESIGQAFISSLGLDGEWKQTSYNGNFRKQYAGIGCTYSYENDRFIDAKPFASWVLNADYIWEAPIQKPSLDGVWAWDEPNQQWIR